MKIRSKHVLFAIAAVAVLSLGACKKPAAADSAASAEPVAADSATGAATAAVDSAAPAGSSASETGGGSETGIGHH